MRIPNDVLSVLRDVQCEGSVAKMPQLSRELYVKVNKVLECLGGTWNRKLKGHLFDGDPGDRLNDAVTTEEVIDPKKEFQFFETPEELADEMVNIAALGKRHDVLEPSAGKGAIVGRILRMAPYIGSLTAVDLNAAFLNECLRKHPGHTYVAGVDFLRVSFENMFDRIVMNPPFRHGQDIAHVEHAYNALKPGGRLVAITSPGWQFRTDKKHTAFRDKMSGGWKAGVRKNDSGAFKSSGTMVNTLTVWIDKASV